MPKYNLKAKTIYEVFPYPKEEIDYALSLFREGSQLALLRQKWGPKFDGVGKSFQILSYMEQMRLESVLRILDERLKGIDALEKRGKTLAEVQKLLKGKSEEVMVQILMNAQSSHVKETRVPYRNLNLILSAHKATENMLSEALSYIEDSKTAFIYKRYYGISCISLSKEEIMKYQGLTETQLNEVLLSVQEDLDVLLAKARKQRQEESVMRAQEKQRKEAKKTKGRSRVVAKKKESLPYEPIAPCPVKAKYPYPEKFRDNFSILKPTDSEYEKALSYQMKKSPSMYEGAKEFYGENLDQPLGKPVQLIKEKKVLDTMIHGMNIYIYQQREIVQKQEAKRKEKEEKEKLPFAEYFFQNIADVEKIDGAILAQALIIQKEKRPNAYELSQKLYGTMLQDSLKQQRMRATDIKSVQFFIRMMEKTIQKLNQKDPVHTGGRQRPKTFYDYFYTDDMSEDEKSQTKKFVKDWLDVRTEKKGTQAIIKLYGQRYDALNQDVELSTTEESAVHYVRTSIHTHIEAIKNPEQAKSIRNLYRTNYETFYDYFYTPFMSPQERAEVKKKVKAYLDIKRGHHRVKPVVKLYGENYDHLDETATFSATEDSYFSKVKREIQQFLLSGKEISTLTKPKEYHFEKAATFYDYFYKDEMSEEEKEEVKEKVKAYLDKRKYQKNVQTLLQMYGPTYSSYNADMKCTSTQKSHFYYLRQSVEKYLEEGEKETKFSFNFTNTFFENIEGFENLSEEEKKSIVLFQKQKSQKAYLICQSLYGENLDEELHPVFMKSKEKNCVFHFFEKLKKRGKQLSTEPLSYFSKFYTEEMSEEEKRSVDASVLAFVRERQYVEAYQLLQEAFGRELNRYNPFVITQEHRIAINTVTRSYRNYQKSLTQPEAETSRSACHRLGTYTNFLESFATPNMSEEEKKEQADAIYAYLQRRGKEDIQTLKKLFGKKYDHFNHEIDITPEDQKDIKRIRAAVVAHLKSERPPLPLTFFEYFYTEEMSEEEKESIRNVTFQYMKKHPTYASVQGIQKIYGKDLMTLHIENANNDSRKHIYSLRRGVQIEMEKATEKEKVRQTWRNSFFDYFYTEEMSEKEKEQIKQEVKTYLIQNQHLQIVQKVILLYGEDFETYHPDANITKTEAGSIRSLMSKIRKARANQKTFTSKRGRKRPATYFDYFYTEEMSEEAKEHTKAFVLQYIEEEQLNMEDVVLLYGPTYDTLDIYRGLPSSKKSAFHNQIVKIKKAISREAKNQPKEGKKVKRRVEKRPSREIHVMPLQEDANYLMQVVYKAYQYFKDLDLVYQNIGLSLDDYVNVLLSLMGSISVEDIATFITTYAPHRFDDLFTSDYFDRMGSSLTSTEKEVIYLKLLAKMKPELTDDAIAQITGVPVSEITSYQVMTSCDELNQFNQYMKK